MGLRRFRSHEEAARELWTGPDDPGLWARVLRNLRRSQRLMPPGSPPYPRGLHRFRTLEDAERARAAWEGQRIAAGARRIRS